MFRIFDNPVQILSLRFTTCIIVYMHACIFCMWHILWNKFIHIELPDILIGIDLLKFQNACSYHMRDYHAFVI